MPTFIRKSDGATVSRKEAIDSSDRLRADYKFGILQPGERVNFDASLCDNKTIRNGERVRVPLLLRDGSATTFLTDAERVFGNSAEGACAVALAKSNFLMTQRHKPEGARQKWTDQMTASAVSAAFKAQEQARRYIADMRSQVPALQREVDQARAGMIARLATAHREGK